MTMDKEALAGWLREESPERLEELWRRADETRRAYVGDAVHLRGLVEISNYCVRECGYCGIRAGNRGVHRYRLTADEILEGARKAVEYGYGTLVMQSGEDYGIDAAWLAGVIERIKGETPLAVTLSLGERPDGDLRLWRSAGADRYLLRFETSDPELYRLIHPNWGGTISDRLAMLGRLRDLGYEAGSGVMVGIPGQTYDNLAADIDLFRSFDLDMIGIGPYMPHPATPLGAGEWVRPVPPGEQVPNDELTTLKALALTRLVCPQSNIPSTTALALIDKERGRELGLMRGANIVMPNLTPLKYRALYEIYPAKAQVDNTSQFDREVLVRRIEAIGRTIGAGPGGRQGR